MCNIKDNKISSFFSFVNWKILICIFVLLIAIIASVYFSSPSSIKSDKEKNIISSVNYNIPSRIESSAIIPSIYSNSIAKESNEPKANKVAKHIATKAVINKNNKANNLGNNNLSDKYPANSNLILNLTKREYNIQYQDQVKALQSPNRKQNLRITYHADGFDVKARKDSAENWNIALQIKGIFKGDKSFLSPSADALENLEKNKLVYKHSGFDVEYINDEKGMRQNFIINNKVQGNEDLRVIMNIKATNLQYSCNGKELSTMQNGVKKYTYSDLKVWDASNRLLKSHMELENNLLALVVNDANAKYPITIDPLSCWTSESNQTTANFGFFVYTAGDVNGDGYDDVVVGADLYDNGQTDEGSAFVYYGCSGGVENTPTWTGESNQANAGYGFHVGTAGDVNNDGYSDIIVSAWLYDNGQTDEGKVYVYYGSSTGLSTSANWTVEADQANAWMGVIVTCAGDVNNDGYDDVAVSAHMYSNGEAFEGRVYVYHGSSTGLSTSANWQQESNQVGASFGHGIAAGDVNGDGYSDLIVAASSYDNGQTDEGKVFVYHGSSSGLSTSSAWSIESDQANAYLGERGVASADVNGDTYNDVIISAYYYDNPSSNEGKAWLYLGSASGLSASSSWSFETDQAGATLGKNSTDGIGDVNGDGYEDIIVGSYNYDNPSSNEGKVWAFFGSSTGLSSIPNWTFESDQVDARLGWSAAKAGDVNNDGYYDLIVGARAYDNGETDEGRAWVFFGDAIKPLPISLTSFSADCRNNDILLKWETESEINNDFFTIERSIDAVTWEFIITVKGAGNSNSKLNYSYSLKSNNETSYFRLKQTDYNGQFEYFKPISINCKDVDSKDIVVYPNPSNGKFYLKGAGENGNMIIYDSQGNTIFKTITISNSMEIELTNYPNGVYSIVIISDGKSISKKVTIAH